MQGVCVCVCNLRFLQNLEIEASGGGPCKISGLCGVEVLELKNSGGGFRKISGFECC